MFISLGVDFNLAAKEIVLQKVLDLSSGHA
jgi:hypothetical protein